jgi:DNA-binding MarR family transcriptional regulator
MAILQSPMHRVPNDSLRGSNDLARSARAGAVEHTISTDLAELDGIDPQVHAVAQRLWLLGRLLDEQAAAIATAHSVSLADWQMLSILVEAGWPNVLRPTQISERLGLTLASVSERISRLVAAGLVERLRLDPDARSRPVRLTRAGSETWRNASLARAGAEEALLLRAFSRSSLARLGGLLKTLLAEVDDTGRAKP